MRENQTRLDRDLAALLGVPERASDRAFLTRVDQRIAEHARFRRQVRALIWRGAGELAAVLALIAGLILLSRLPMLAPYAPATGLSLSSPLILVVLLWMGFARKRWL